MRRKTNTLIPLEREILEVAIDLHRRGAPEAHGFLIARLIGDRTGARRLTAYGTLYKALDRLERAGYLASRWEDPQAAADDHRPRRRFYRVTSIGEAAGATDARRARNAVVRRAAEPVL